MRRFILLALCFTALFIPSLPATSLGYALPLSPRQEKTFFPIVAWHSIPNGMAVGDRLKELADCGITVHMTHAGTPEEMKNILDAAEKLGLKVLIHDKRIESAPADIAGAFKDHPALYGYDITDEPTVKDFPKLASIVSALRVKDPVHPAYINLLPSFARGLGTASYEDYVERFIKEVKPGFLSYDHYPISKRGNKLQLKPVFYQNLEICSLAARKHNLDLWTFALTTPHEHTSQKWEYPMPTEGHLRFQIYADLAYGARAIEYFTYWTPNSYNPYRFHDGPIDSDGKRTATYDILTKINREIATLAPLLLTLRVVETCHAEPLPLGTKGLSPKSPVTKIEGNAFISVAEREGKKGENAERYLWVVSRSYAGEEKARLTLTPEIKRLDEVGRGGGETLALTPSSGDRSVSLSLSAGDGRLFKIVE